MSTSILTHFWHHEVNVFSFKTTQQTTLKPETKKQIALDVIIQLLLLLERNKSRDAHHASVGMREGFPTKISGSFQTSF